VLARQRVSILRNASPVPYKRVDIAGTVCPGNVPLAFTEAALK
jgi:hypothetical protein